jgi:hypothetical protein
LADALEDSVGPSLHEHGKKLAEKAAGYLGEYHGEIFQPALVLDVPAWEPLAPATIARKAGGDTPELESGNLFSSIDSQTLERPGPSMSRSGGGKTPVWVESIGSNLPYAQVQERGSEDGRIPPRPYLTRALAEMHYQMTVTVDDAVESALSRVFG